MTRKAQSYLESCSTDATIYLNGRKISTDSASRQVVRDLGWAKVYSRKLSGDNYSSYATVRIKGITMFRKWISESKFDVVIDIERPSTEVLQASRDGFHYTKDEEIQRLIAEITIDQKSFGRMHKTSTTFEGGHRSFSVKAKEILRLETGGVSQAVADVAVAAVEEAVESRGSEGARTDLSRAILETVRERVVRDFSGTERDSEVEKVLALVSGREQEIAEAYEKGPQCENLTDFVIDINDTGYNTIPPHLDPNRMGKKKVRLAKLWKHCLELVFKADGLSLNYAIGWVIDQDLNAQYQEREDGVHIFQLNPTRSDTHGASNKELFFKILASAAHEVAHMDHNWHSESFSLRNQALFTKTVINVDSWWNEFVAAGEQEL